MQRLNRLSAIYITGAPSTAGGMTAEDNKKVKASQGNIAVTTTGEKTFQVNGATFTIRGEEGR